MNARNPKLRLIIGDVLQKRWCIKKLLGEGVYGAVYEVFDVRNPTNLYALKIESNDPSDKSIKLLPLEVAVLRALRQIDAAHFPGYEMCGKTERFNFVVMGLVGKNINDLRKSLPDQKFSLYSAIHIGIHSLAGIREIHQAGYLHRDIKPANMCIGRDPHDLRGVYILDWGMCRKYVDDYGQLNKQRIRAQFRGTPYYCSVNALFHVDQGRVDDVWAWFFCLIEFTVGKLPWEDDEPLPPKTTDYLKWLGQKKKSIVADVNNICRNCPAEFIEIYDSLQNIDFFSQPEYPKYTVALENILTRYNVSPKTPLDWEPDSETVKYTSEVPYYTMIKPFN